MYLLSTYSIASARFFLIGFAALVFLFANLAQAQLPYCSATFQNAVQTHVGQQNFINFGHNARITNASSHQLRTPSVTFNNWSEIKSCGGQHCYAGAEPVPQLWLNELPGTNSNLEYNVPARKKMIIGEDVVSIGKVELAEHAIGEFSSRGNHYIIDRLFLGFKSTLRLPEGNYYIRSIRMEVGSRIDIIGEGTVNLFVQDHIDVPFKALINANTKDPSRLVIFGQSSSQYHVLSKTYAFVVTENELILSHGAKIYGGLVGKYIFLESESEVVFDPAAARMAALSGLCTITPLGTDTTPPVITISSYGVSEPYYILDVAGRVEDVGPNASGLASVFAKSPGYEEPVYLDGTNFSTQVFMDLGLNLVEIIATDVAGNQSSSSFTYEYPPVAYFANIYPTDGTVFTEPNILVTGEVKSFWAFESIGGFTINGSGYDLMPNDDYGSLLEAPLTLKVGRNEIVLKFREPNAGDVVHKMVVYYEPSPAD